MCSHSYIIKRLPLSTISYQIHCEHMYLEWAYCANLFQHRCGFGHNNNVAMGCCGLSATKTSSGAQGCGHSLVARPTIDKGLYVNCKL